MSFGLNSFGLQSLGLSPSDAVGPPTHALTTSLSAQGTLTANLGTSIRLATALSAVATLSGTLPVSLAGFNLNASEHEFGQRTGLGLADFMIDASVDYRLNFFADGLTMSAPVHVSATLTTSSIGRLTRYENAAFVVGTTYRIVAIRQSDGEACEWRMTAT